MLRGLIALAFASLLHGCVVLAAMMGCGGGEPPGVRDPECDVVDDAAQGADSTVIDAIRNRPPDEVHPLVPVRLEGRITEHGVPIVRAAVRLTLEGTPLAVVRTDSEGRYALAVLAEEPTCAELRLSVSMDEGRSSDPAEPGCVEGTLDYDFGAGTWTSGSGFAEAAYRSSRTVAGRSTPISNATPSTRRTSASR